VSGPDAFWRDRRARLGLAVLGVVIAAAVLAPLLSPIHPDAQRNVVETRFLAPLSTDAGGIFHPLGTDRLGRDVWARLLYGARISLVVGILGMVVSLVIGIAVGAAAASGPPPVTTFLLGAADFALGLPRVVLGLTGWMPVARLVYADIRAQLARPYIEASRSLGAGGARVLLRHALPNAMAPVLALATLGVGNAITLEAGLSFLGLGVQPPASSWGSMIASGRDTVVNAPWVGLAPGVALVIVVVACTLIADVVEERGN
jgi:peptide/nickel transport system permease protein